MVPTVLVFLLDLSMHGLLMLAGRFNKITVQPCNHLNIFQTIFSLLVSALKMYFCPQVVFLETHILVTGYVCWIALVPKVTRPVATGGIRGQYLQIVLFPENFLLCLFVFCYIF